MVGLKTEGCFFHPSSALFCHSRFFLSGIQIPLCHSRSFQAGIQKKNMDARQVISGTHDLKGYDKKRVIPAFPTVIPAFSWRESKKKL